jgi:hypothetical protein
VPGVDTPKLLAPEGLTVKVPEVPWMEPSVAVSVVVIEASKSLMLVAEPTPLEKVTPVAELGYSGAVL